MGQMGAGFSPTAKLELPKVMKGFKEYRKYLSLLPTDPEADLAWGIALSKGDTMLRDFWEQVVYGARFDGSRRQVMKMNKSAAEALGWQGFKEEVDKIYVEAKKSLANDTGTEAPMCFPKTSSALNKQKHHR